MRSLPWSLRCFVLASSVPAAAVASTWYVAPGGNGSGTSPAAPLGSISAAYQSAGQGDVIELAGGNYPGETIANKSASGSWTQNVLVRPAAGSTARVTGTLRVDAAHLTLSGLVAQSSVFLQSPVGHARVENMQLGGTLFIRTNNVFVTDSLFPGGAGLDAIQVGAKSSTARSSNIVIQNNLIRDYYDLPNDPNDIHEDGIQLFDTQNVTIRGNTILNVVNGSIITSVGRGLGVSNVRIENNFIRKSPDGTNGFGTLNLLYAGVEDLQVVNNTIIADVHVANTAEVLLRNNILDRLQVVGAQVQRDHNLVGSRGAGIALGSGDRSGSLPRFVHDASGDLHIAPSNTADLSFANVELAPVQDFDGEMRLNPVWVGADQVVPEPAGMFAMLLAGATLMGRRGRSATA